jgi:F-type H+-transporting ATPase subunit epsilon
MDEDVDEVTAPGARGEIGILPDHISFLTELEIGEVSYKQGTQRFHLALSGGYAEVLENVMTVLANAAEFGYEIDEERARRAQERADKKLEESNCEEVEFVSAEAALRRALIRLQVARKAPRK